MLYILVSCWFERAIYQEVGADRVPQGIMSPLYRVAWFAKRAVKSSGNRILSRFKASLSPKRSAASMRTSVHQTASLEVIIYNASKYKHVAHRLLVHLLRSSRRSWLRRCLTAVSTGHHKLVILQGSTAELPAAGRNSAIPANIAKQAIQTSERVLLRPRPIHLRYLTILDTVKASFEIVHDTSCTLSSLSWATRYAYQDGS